MQAKRVVVKGVEDVVVEPFVLDEKQLGSNDCLIKTYVSFISAGTELSRVFGLKKGATYPVYPGYCSVGKILAKGDKVKNVEVDDVVLFSGPHASHQIFNVENSDGGVLYKLNKETAYQDGALLMMAEISLNGIIPVDVKCGDKAIIIGAGMVGAICAILYKQMGVDVIVAEPAKYRAEILRSSGIEKIVTSIGEQQVKDLLALCENKGADIVVDASGLSQCIETAFKVAAKNGQVVLLGSPRVDYTCNVTPIFSNIHMKMLKVIGGFNRRFNYDEVNGTRINLARELKYLEGLFNKKIINSDLFVSHHIAPNDQELLVAYEGLMHDKEHYSGVIIDWDK